MSELHKPLGKSDEKPTSRNWRWPVAGIIAVCLLGLSAYLFFDARQGNRTIVAIDTTPQAPDSPAAAKAPEPKQTEDTEFDLSKVKPLTPLIPLEEEQRPTAQPVFKPQKKPVTRRSAWVPDPDLVEKSEFGPLPRVSDGNVRPLDAYSQSSGITGANRVALILGGLGLSQTGTQSAIKTLPSSITMGFSPLGNSLQRWMQLAKKEGHEVILQLPMEPLGYPAVNPGPRTLTSSAPPGENLMNLRWALGRMTNYPLVMNYLGGGMSSNPSVLRPLLTELRQRGLGYLDDGSISASIAINLAQEIRLPHASGNIVIDANRSKDRIRASLRTLEALAKARGYAIGSASAFPETVEILKEWAQDAEKRGIIIVPASNLLKDYGR